MAQPSLVTCQAFWSTDATIFRDMDRDGRPLDSTLSPAGPTIAQHMLLPTELGNHSLPSQELSETSVKTMVTKAPGFTTLFPGGSY